MEALRTQLDNLQWEVNRLRAENQRLRDTDVEAGARVDLEAELRASRVEVAELEERVKENEQREAENSHAVAEARETAKTAESRADASREELEETRCRLRDAAEELRRAQEAVATLKETVEASEARADELHEKLETGERELQDQADLAARERAALELERYRAVESTTKEWVARERRLTDQLDELLTRLSACSGQQNDSALCDQLQQRLLSVTDEVHNYESVVSELRGENEGLQLRTEELKAELAFAWARVRRLERAEPRTSDGEGSTGQPESRGLPGHGTSGWSSCPRASESHAHVTFSYAYPSGGTASECFPVVTSVHGGSPGQSEESVAPAHAMSVPGRICTASVPWLREPSVAHSLTSAVPERTMRDKTAGQSLRGTGALPASSTMIVEPSGTYGSLAAGGPGLVGPCIECPSTLAGWTSSQEVVNRLPAQSGVLAAAPAASTLARLPPGTPRDMRSLNGTMGALPMESETGVVNAYTPLGPSHTNILRPSTGVYTTPLTLTPSGMLRAPIMSASTAAIPTTPLMGSFSTGQPVDAPPAVTLDGTRPAAPTVRASRQPTETPGDQELRAKGQDMFSSVPASTVVYRPTTSQDTPTSMGHLMPPATTSAQEALPVTSSAGVVPALGVTYSGAYPAALANLLPQIPNFNGSEQRDGETIQDWMEHFESVATLAGWSDHFKLVHLTSALRGSARSFFPSCTPAQKSNYQLLVAELKKRFTPVQLTAVQTQLFHSRRQGMKESVDDFAQELRKLHSKAYAATTYANPEAEKVGQMVLANQFISGLRPELQAKVVGMEGSMDALVLKARFEEAKAKELTGAKGTDEQETVCDQRWHNIYSGPCIADLTHINQHLQPPVPNDHPELRRWPQTRSQEVFQLRNGGTHGPCVPL